MLHIIESYTTFDMILLDFWETDNIPFWDGSSNIMICLDFMTGLGLGSDSGLKNITPEQVSQWDFENFFVTFGLPKMAVVDAYGVFSRMFRNNFRETLPIMVHAVATVNHKAIRVSLLLK